MSTLDFGHTDILKEFFDSAIEQMREKAQKTEKAEHEVLTK